MTMTFTYDQFTSFLEYLHRQYLRFFGTGLDKTLEEGYFHEMCRYWRLTRLYNASNHTDDDLQKMQYVILRENHIIEKGMSMLQPRKGFGQEKVMALIQHLARYAASYGAQDAAFLAYPLSTVQAYILYTRQSGVEIPEIERAFAELTRQYPDLTLQPHEAGIRTMSREQLLEVCNKDFSSLLHSRHSLRYFSEQEVSRELITQALEMAQRTPSACNRQGWHTHVFKGEESVRLIYWQEGCRGCEDGFRQSILVTANLKAFLLHEVFQAYIDGALYAMNLVNAFHSLGLGTIPLSCGFSYDKLQYLDQFHIPEHEVPIVIIAFGHVTEEFHYAASSRKDIQLTNTFHDS